jgi:hypothetical protein
MNRKELLDKAESLVSAERDEQYGVGSTAANFHTIAILWDAYLARRRADGYLTITVGDVSALMILLKVARLAGAPGHQDSWIDIAGYAAIGCELTGKKA